MGRQERILVSTEGGVKTLAIHIPERRNALAPEDALALALEVEESERDGTRVVVVTGTDGAFCAGADLASDMFSEVREGRAPREQTQDETVDRTFHRMVRAVTKLPLPVIAAVDGPAAGIGCSLALQADLTLASTRARFIELFVNIALIPDGGSTWILPRIVGIKKAMEMILTGDPVSAEEALALGMVNRVFPPEHLPDETRKLALRLAAGPVRTMGLAKRTVYESQRTSKEAALDLECRRQARLMTQPDFIEAVQAFLAKRKPTFS